MMSILVVCTANVCRSPMAEALLRRAAARRGVASSVVVASTGVASVDGRAASEGSVAALERLGVDISAHRSRELDPREIGRADLIVTMESDHVVELVVAFPDVVGRAFPLRELVGLASAAPAPSGDGFHPVVSAADAVAWLEAISGSRSVRGHLGRTDLDVDDPMGRSRSQYRRCAAQLEQLCESLATSLWGPERPDQLPAEASTP